MHELQSCQSNDPPVVRVPKTGSLAPAVGPICRPHQPRPIRTAGSAPARVWRPKSKHEPAASPRSETRGLCPGLHQPHHDPELLRPMFTTQQQTQRRDWRAARGGGPAERPRDRKTLNIHVNPPAKNSPRWCTSRPSPRQPGCAHPRIPSSQRPRVPNRSGRHGRWQQHSGSAQTAGRHRGTTPQPHVLLAPGTSWSQRPAWLRARSRRMLPTLMCSR